MNRSGAPWLRPWAALVALLLACHAVPLASATPEAQVKAAYLFKLASFVRWPQDAGGASFRICVSGRPDIAQVLTQLTANQRVEDKPVAVVRLEADDEEEAQACDILFLGRGGRSARALFAASASAPVLTVTDRNNGTRGGAVDFALQDGKVRLFIKRSEAEGRGLTLNSKLLDVAAGVAP